MFKKLGKKLVKLAFTVAVIGIAWGFAKTGVRTLIDNYQPQEAISNMVEDLKYNVESKIEDLKDNIGSTLNLDNLGVQDSTSDDGGDGDN